MRAGMRGSASRSEVQSATHPGSITLGHGSVSLRRAHSHPMCAAPCAVHDYTTANAHIALCPPTLPSILRPSCTATMVEFVTHHRTSREAGCRSDHAFGLLVVMDSAQRRWPVGWAHADRRACAWPPPVLAAARLPPCCVGWSLLRHGVRHACDLGE